MADPKKTKSQFFDTKINSFISAEKRRSKVLLLPLKYILFFLRIRNLKNIIFAKEMTL